LSKSKSQVLQFLQVRSNSKECGNTVIAEKRRAGVGSVEEEIWDLTDKAKRTGKEIKRW